MQDFPESISIFHLNRDRRISGKEAGNVDVKQGDLENFLKLKCGNYEEFAVQIYQKNVHAESRIEQEDVYKLCKKMHELQMHNKSLEEKLKGMEMEIKRLQAKEEGEIYIEYVRVYRSSVCS